MTNVDALRILERQARRLVYDLTEDQRDELATLALTVALARRTTVTTTTKNALDRDIRSLAPELTLALHAVDALAMSIEKTS